MSLADGLAIVLFMPVTAALFIHIHALFTPPGRRKILTLALIYTGIYLLLLGLIHLIVGNVGILPFFILAFVWIRILFHCQLDDTAFQPPEIDPELQKRLMSRIPQRKKPTGKKHT
jgi:hypothetical protein